MKKLFICALAVGMFTACSQEETLSTQAPMQISFDGAFVESATRAADPSITTESIKNFSVWAYVDNANGTGQVFNDVTVTKNDEAWTYSPLQYWAPSNSYYFFALATNTTTDYKGEVADETLKANGIGEISFTNADGTEDLLYATQTATTGATITTAPDPVKFVFDHLLSKVKFTFKNGFATGYSTIKVTNIKMVVPGQGTIALKKQGEYTWKLGEGDKTLEFGTISNSAAIEEGKTGESDNERLTIPASAEEIYTVYFDAELFQDGASVLKSSKAVTISDCELKPGYAYNFVATLDPTNIGENPLFPIEFEAEVAEWVEPNDFGFFSATNVETADQLVEALANGGEYNLIADIKLPAETKISTEVILYLNGKTLTTESYDDGDMNNIVFDVIEGGKLTINGDGTVETTAEYYSIPVWAHGGEVIINGGTFKNAGNGSDVVYASAGGKVIINGGTFIPCENTGAEPGTKEAFSALNLKDGTGSSIVCYGGSYYKFNPADNVSESPKVSFVAEGYESVAEGDYFVVKAE